MGGKNAYVWLLMLGDKYLPGLLVSAYSIKRIGTENDLVAMVTPDVSRIAINELMKIFDKVKKVNYITYRHRFKNKRQKEKYGKWMHLSPTKWNCINFIEYEKVFFLDADTVITQNIDNVFKFNRISGVFSSPWSKKDSRNKDYYQNNRLITPDLIQKGLFRNGFVAFATGVLLKPNKNDFYNYKRMLNTRITFNSWSGTDELTLAYFMSLYKNGPKLTWRNLSECYNHIWKEESGCCPKHKSQKGTVIGPRICSRIKVIHLFGDVNAWESRRKSYQDIDMWFSLCREMLDNTTVNINNINIKYKKEINKSTDKKNKYVKIFHKEIA